MLKTAQPEPLPNLNTAFKQAIWNWIDQPNRWGEDCWGKFLPPRRERELFLKWSHDPVWAQAEALYLEIEEALSATAAMGPRHTLLGTRFRERAPICFFEALKDILTTHPRWSLKSLAPRFEHLMTIIIRGLLVEDNRGFSPHWFIASLINEWRCEADYQAEEELILEGAGISPAAYIEKLKTLQKTTHQALFARWRALAPSHPKPKLIFNRKTIVATDVDQSLTLGYMDLDEKQQPYILINLRGLARGHFAQEHSASRWEPCGMLNWPAEVETLLTHELLHYLSTGQPAKWTGRGQQKYLLAAKRWNEEKRKIKIKALIPIGLSPQPIGQKTPQTPVYMGRMRHFTMVLRLLNEWLTEAATWEVLNLPADDVEVIYSAYYEGARFMQKLLGKTRAIDLLLAPDPLTELVKIIKTRLSVAATNRYLEIIFDPRSRFFTDESFKIDGVLPYSLGETPGTAAVLTKILEDDERAEKLTHKIKLKEV